MAHYDLRGAAAERAARPGEQVYSLSGHVFKSHRRHQARVRQELRIHELEQVVRKVQGELQQWQAWYRGEPHQCQDAPCAISME
eukprot:8348605-Heterocapsa_arctica.AAC.1